MLKQNIRVVLPTTCSPRKNFFTKDQGKLFKKLSTSDSSHYYKFEITVTHIQNVVPSRNKLRLPAEPRFVMSLLSEFLRKLRN